MEATEAVPAAEGAEPIIVRADEVDEAGADISTIPDAATDRELTAQIESRRVQDAQVVSSPKVLANAVLDREKPMPRPILRREGSAPPPPQQPPASSPQQMEEETGNATDSLSLLQLRRLVTDLPRFEPMAYAFTYSDTQSFPEELEEWFQYTEEERYLLTRAKLAFAHEWKAVTSPESSLEGPTWTEAEDSVRNVFVRKLLEELDQPDLVRRAKSVESLAYIALGVWGDSAGLPSREEKPDPGADTGDQVPDKYGRSAFQIEWIRKNAGLLQKAGAPAVLFSLLRRTCDSERNETQSGFKAQANGEATASQGYYNRQQETNNILTLLYVLVEVGRWEVTDGQTPSIRRAIAALQPSFLLFLTQFIANLRWEDNTNVPLTRVLLLYWKSVLLLFGGTEELNESKADLRDESDPIDEDSGEGFITASPLDYHLFRQEITSKYPAYNPPPPLVPLELENNSILPPLPNHPSRSASFDGLYIGAGNVGNGVGLSILNQPVHIATPAPSPPPSPAGPGGKGGKKQNYQTNQNFPFLYPPLDETTDAVGGKGSAVLQSELGKTRWGGSDIPASISEAGQLFANRMRMTRSLRQLWDEREKYMKFERGWGGPTKDTEMDDILDNPSLDDSSEEWYPANQEEEAKVEEETDNEEVQRRLDAVESFYRQAMPQLQSVVIVLLKVILANVTAIATQNNGQNGLQNGYSFPENGADAILGRPKSNLDLAQQLNGSPKGPDGHIEDNADPGLEELNAVRLREITAKAISGILIMMLKWFKLSHILKYEYLTQLLLDSNYLPLVLKFFAHQDVDRAIDQRNDREDLNFLYFCQSNSRNLPTEPLPRLPSSSSSSSDDAQPPPIMKHRRSPTSESSSLPPSPPPPELPPRPEVDELGYPTTGPLPTTLLTNFSARNFFILITLLSILQKVTKRKAHRALLLVQYKSSTILRKALKIPQPELRLYTLKLFKSQVRYCGRKWRQSNMRVITAIYLHCRPELRDEWLSGSDVDAEVEEAVPLEQAVRGLVHWWHLRNYPEVMGEEVGKDSEGDFFARELERMGWGVGVGFAGDDADEPPVEDGAAGGSEWDGAPLQMVGW